MTEQSTKMWSGRFGQVLACMLGLVLLCLGKPCTAQARQRTFTLQNVGLKPGERIIEIDLDIMTGAFNQVSPLPAGWHIVIENSADSSAHTKFSGSCSIGAASLDLEQLRKLTFVMSQESTGRHPVKGSIHVVDWKRLDALGTKAERDIPLTISNLEFKESTRD